MRLGLALLWLSFMLSQSCSKHLAKPKTQQTHAEDLAGVKQTSTKNQLQLQLQFHPQRLLQQQQQRSSKFYCPAESRYKQQKYAANEDDNDDEEAEYEDEDDESSDDVDDDDEYVDEAEDDTDAFDEMQFNDRISCILRSLYEDNVGLAEDLTQLDLAIFPAEQGNESALKQKTASKTRAAAAATPKQQPQPQPLKAASKPNGFFSQLFMPPLLKLLNQQSSHSCSSNGNSKLPQNQRYLRALHDLRVSQAVHAISKARRQLQHKAAGTESEDVYEHNLKRIVNNQLAIERRVAGLLPHARAVQV